MNDFGQVDWDDQGEQSHITMGELKNVIEKLKNENSDDINKIHAPGEMVKEYWSAEKTIKWE